MRINEKAGTKIEGLNGLLTKRCRRCSKTKPIEDFSVCKRNKDGHQSYCRVCSVEYSRGRKRAPVIDDPEKRAASRKRFFENNPDYMQLWRESHPGHQRRYRMKRVYGLTEQDYKDILGEQNNLCGLCRERFPIRVDHDHYSGVVRGILCNRCNIGLHLTENEDLFEKAMIYLAKARGVDAILESMKRLEQRLRDSMDF